MISVFTCECLARMKPGSQRVYMTERSGDISMKRFHTERRRVPSVCTRTSVHSMSSTGLTRNPAGMQAIVDGGAPPLGATAPRLLHVPWAAFKGGVAGA